MAAQNRGPFGLMASPACSREQLPSMGLQELRGVARGLKMRGYSKLRKEELRSTILDKLSSD